MLEGGVDDGDVRLKGVEALVEDGVVSLARGVQAEEPILPLHILLVEAHTHLLLRALDLLQDELEVWIHDSPGMLVSSVVP